MFDEWTGQISRTRTDRNGEYFTAGLPNGDMRVFVVGQKYIMGARKVAISGARDAADVDISLEPGATISGTVTDSETGLPIAGMEVIAGLVGQELLSQTITDVNGNYTTRGLPDGDVEISVEGQGFIQMAKIVTITNGNDVFEFDF